MEGGREAKLFRERGEKVRVLKVWGEQSRGACEIKGKTERDRWRAELGWRRKPEHQRYRERERETEPDVLVNTAKEPRAAQSPLYLTGPQSNHPPRLCVCVYVQTCVVIHVQYMAVHVQNNVLMRACECERVCVCEFWRGVYRSRSLSPSVH